MKPQHRQPSGVFWTKDEFQCPEIPEGWEQVKSGRTQPGDIIWSRDPKNPHWSLIDESSLWLGELVCNLNPVAR